MTPSDTDVLGKLGPAKVAGFNEFIKAYDRIAIAANGCRVSGIGKLLAGGDMNACQHEKNTNCPDKSPAARALAGGAPIKFAPGCILTFGGAQGFLDGLKQTLPTDLFDCNTPVPQIEYLFGGKSKTQGIFAKIKTLSDLADACFRN